MTRKLRLFVFTLLFATTAVFAQDFVPEELEGWKQWVLKDREYRECAFYFDRNASDRRDFVCSWPGRLRLDVNANGASFTQQWTLHAEDQWIALPGSVEHWPDRVTANGRPVEVVARNNVPSIRLSPGTYSLAGRFAWDDRPGELRLPPGSGLVSLTVDGKAVERPDIGRNGVFLGERKQDVRAADSVRTVVYRLVADAIPTRLETQLQIDVSGSMREEVFGPVLPEGFVPLSLQGQLPVKLEADGKLRMQVRPGRWIINLSARAPGVLDVLNAVGGGTNLPETEIWSYQSNDRLRVTAVENLPPVDPSQAAVPKTWESYPAFRVAPGAALTIIERSRGIISASNELSMDRTMWLDFEGGGFVVEDFIGGTMRAGWRLDMGDTYALLAATEYGDSLLVTEGEDDGQTGIEIRQSAVDIEALGRSETRGAMLVTGWDARFTDVDATLNLPPGHKLLTAPGVDSAVGSWTGQWQLLDFFLLLIITIAVWRLFSPVAGVVAMLALVLSFHELFAPTWLWLNVLVAVALLRVAPEGKLRKIVRSYQLLSAAALLIALVPFIAAQLRVAIYPQLEPQYDRFGLYSYTQDDELTDMRESGLAREPASTVARQALKSEAALEEMVTTASLERQSFSRFAPNAIVQAGPGIPSWRWNSYRLSWNGPVDANQTMRLVILPGWLVSALRFVEVVLMLLFAGIVAAEVANRRWSLPGGFTLGRSAATSLLAAGLCVSMLGSSLPAHAETPSAELLQQLEQRLLEPPDCVPRCAEIVAADVSVSGNAINMTLDVHALESVAVPLPGNRQGWSPQAVSLDGAAGARVFMDADSRMWLRVSAGRHQVSLRGAIPSADSIEIPFPTPPRIVTVDSDGWFVAGVQDRRLLSGSLQLTRLQTETDGPTARWESSRFPPFARIERTVELDLDWRVRTTVYRVAPQQGALTLRIPLVDGESILSGDFTVDDNEALSTSTVLVTMNPQQHSVSWVSNLPRTSPLELRAGDGSAWNDVWRVVVGNIWRVSFSGLPESNAGNDADGVRVAEFDPRAGEILTISASRPEAASGSTLAFDEVNLNVQQGDRSSDVTMHLKYRSTRGAQHVISLPPSAELTRVNIDGREQTLRAEGAELTLPILPGEHDVTIEWLEAGDAGFRTVTPNVDLGAPASNINLGLKQPMNRWLLGTTGPKLGPAVLYWPELAALVLFALILGRIGLAPLTTWHWLLLGLGFSTFSWQVLAVVAAWLLVCGARERISVGAFDQLRFNLVQVLVGGLTVIALLAIVTALPQGLLGTPDMHVVGHNSSAAALNWFADRSESMLPVASALSVPMWIYKALILAWALWLSFSLLRWLPWVWQQFSRDGLWRGKNESGTQDEAGGEG